MPRIADAPGATLAVGLAVVVLAATANAGLDARPIPPSSWALWAIALAVALGLFAAARLGARAALARLAGLVPIVALFALPAAACAAPGHRLAVLGGLAARAFAASAAAAGIASALGPAGLVAGARQLRLPAHFVDVLAATLAGLAVVTRQATAMLRAREARRPSRGAWPRLLAAPAATVRGFGRLVGSLMLRSLERGEALERARRARGGAE